MSMACLVCIPGVAFGAALSVSVAIAGESEDGKALFEARCSDCHDRPEITDWAGQWSDPADRRARLDGLLRKHYPPPEDERQAIVDYLISDVRSQ